MMFGCPNSIEHESHYLQGVYKNELLLSLTSLLLLLLRFCGQNVNRFNLNQSRVNAVLLDVWKTCKGY